VAGVQAEKIRMRSVHELRAHGWFVGDDIELPNVDVDHVLVGPAGVLAVQVMWSNEPDPRGRAEVRARIAAKQLRHELAVRELPVDVVPAVLACGPGQPQLSGGVKLVDGVAFLFDESADEWVTHLASRELLPEPVVDDVREVVAGLLELAHA
jgi:hypothetical protein